MNGINEQLLINKYKFMITNYKKVDLFDADLDHKEIDSNDNIAMEIIEMLEKKYKTFLNLLVNSSACVEGLSFKILYDNKNNLFEIPTIIKIVNTFGEEPIRKFNKYYRLDYTSLSTRPFGYNPNDLINALIENGTVESYKFIRNRFLHEYRRNNLQECIYDIFIKMLKKNKKSAICSLTSCILDIVYVKKIILEYCCYELLLLSPIPDIINLLDEDMAAKYIDEGYPINT